MVGDCLSQVDEHPRQVAVAEGGGGMIQVLPSRVVGARQPSQDSLQRRAEHLEERIGAGVLTAIAYLVFSLLVSWQLALLAVVPLTLLMLLLLAGTASSFAAARIFCCDDQSGKQVCGDILPSACYGRAYRELGQSGRTSRVVEAPLTAEQRAANGQPQTDDLVDHSHLGGAEGHALEQEGRHQAAGEGVAQLVEHDQPQEGGRTRLAEVAAQAAEQGLEARPPRGPGRQRAAGAGDLRRG